MLFAQLVDDPSGWPDRFPTEEAQDAERRRLHKVIAGLVLWEASNDSSVLNLARWEIARSLAWGLGEQPPPPTDGKAILEYLQRTAPPLYDPFSGGASIPLEGQVRLAAYGSDINPVAVLIGKALVELPPKFVGLPPVNPKARGKLEFGANWSGQGAQGLAEDVRYYGRLMGDEAHRKLGDLYPLGSLEDGSDAQVVAWLWARTVRSPDPSVGGARIPLLSTFLLSQKSSSTRVWLHPVIDPHEENGFRFDIQSGIPAAEEGRAIREGLKTGRGSNFKCLLSQSAISESYIKSEGRAGRLGTTMIAMVVDAKGKRSYRPAFKHHTKIAEAVQNAWSPSQEMPENPRWFSPPEFGFTSYASLFTQRQLHFLSTMSELVPVIAQRVIDDGGEEMNTRERSLPIWLLRLIVWLLMDLLSASGWLKTMHLLLAYRNNRSR